jgi:hypothetical protein
MQKGRALITEQKLSLKTETDSIQDLYYKNSGVVLDISCKKILLIKTGEMKHIEEIQSSFTEQNVSMTSSVSSIMYDHDFSMSKEGHRLTPFACIPVGAFFPKKGGKFSYEEILAAAIGCKISIERESLLESLFLTYCYPQDGTDIRVDYVDQPKGEMIHLAMEKAFPDAEGNLRTFSVGNMDNTKQPTLYASIVKDGKDKEEKKGKFFRTDIVVFRLRKEESCF